MGEATVLGANDLSCPRYAPDIMHIPIVPNTLPKGQLDGIMCQVKMVRAARLATAGHNTSCKLCVCLLVIMVIGASFACACHFYESSQPSARRALFSREARQWRPIGLLSSGNVPLFASLSGTRDPVPCGNPARGRGRSRLASFPRRRAGRQFRHPGGRPG